jgi:RNA-directed DNA polymerase
VWVRLPPSSRNQRTTQVTPHDELNERTNVRRADYDLLKAVLRDAALKGPAVANRQAVPDFRSHLIGRIEWVAALDPRHGEALHARFAAIGWDI